MLTSRNDNPENTYDISDYLSGFATGVQQGFIAIYDMARHPVDHVLIPIGSFVNDVRVIHACREMGLNPTSYVARNTSASECQPAMDGMIDRGEKLNAFIDHFIVASNPERLEIITALTTSAIVPGTVIGGAWKMGTNYHRFGMLTNPMKFRNLFPEDLAPLRDMPLTLNEFRNSVGETAHKYVVLPNGRLVISRDLNLTHADLAKGATVVSAGEIEGINGQMD